ncbi:MAG TPA: aldo/keto reductase [Chloroflexota bacterium]|jgi:aryl-alcohol dehydrogenase-like predicted oxidoreductase|nr:aldo/keto reductase [Chloroflexota bacterium]
MQYRKLGSCGAKVSYLCLGTMNFGGATDETDGGRIIERAMDAGVNFIDTANVYNQGRSEEITGKALADGRRQQVVLATKVHGKMGDGPNDQGNHRLHLFQQVEASLRRLQTDYIDLYYLHRPDPDTRIEEEVRAMDDLVRQGKVRFYGTSHYAAWQIALGQSFAERIGGHPWIVDQPRYSLLDRAIEQDIVPYCHYTGYGLVPHSPLAGGFLTAKYARDAQPEAGTRAARQAGMLTNRAEAHWDLLERVKAVAANHQASAGQVAVAWVLTRPWLSATIIGPRTLEQVEDNLGAADLTLSPEEVSALEQASAFAAQMPRT